MCGNLSSVMLAQFKTFLNCSDRRNISLRPDTSSLTDCGLNLWNLLRFCIELKTGNIIVSDLVMVASNDNSVYQLFN